MISINADHRLLRDLARRYLEVCHQPTQPQKRQMWAQLHNLEATQPLIYIRAFAWSEMAENTCYCTDPLLRSVEAFFRQAIFRASFNDDFVFTPWVDVPAVYECTGFGISGVRQRPQEERGAWKLQYPLQTYEDMGKLRTPWHAIDEKKTNLRVSRLHDVIGDIITVNSVRGPAYTMWNGDLSTHLGYLRGIVDTLIIKGASEVSIATPFMLFKTGPM